MLLIQRMNIPLDIALIYELTYYKDFMFRPKHEAGYSANAIWNLCPMEYFHFQ
jgi:hypothetical protein